ncbi:precorrin-6y C5,15-methyltransferase (decarboxylating) subunit CbiE [Aestuariivirga litoralis]|uniref:precorrin-6y C5,15-methyltransferase (decarboxylating) subunit CbiE n=1 Tax=Aestuariivirga litoralis TaxID=2650924 RepID=UPI0018C5DBC1|nr:precorrin-6y C5,15-methyltransferase (decarboxylating) subunit CbiE [Aestuariivirga litoralis]MBG1231347.1 precorrin-6y C5,15-methyltransferase (decarboxylating) subunit CbiE [Aestuariivirga litoralis]
MTQWLSIIGMGEDGYEALSAAAQSSLQKAEIIIASERMFEMLPALKAERHLWPQPFSAVYEQVKAFAGRRTVLLATGDPMNFGVARKIFEIAPRDDIAVIPHLSAFSLAAARMGWSIPDCDCFTIHGRPAANLETFIQPDARLLVLTQDETSVAEACRRLIARGFEASRIAVLENMGGPQERVTHFTAAQNPALDWSPLNTLAIHCIASPNAKIWSRVAGLPDEAFVHDGQLTKREVRAATLSALAPAPDQMLWDVGAGCGSIAIEWMRSTRGCEAIAIEHDEARCAMIAQNIDQFGTPRLKLVEGEAPAALAGLARPHAVFIGGGIGVPGVFEAAWDALLPGGRMVANVVTIEGEMHLYDLQGKHGGELTRIEVSRLEPVGKFRALKPKMAVTQWRTVKP